MHAGKENLFSLPLQSMRGTTTKVTTFQSSFGVMDTPTKNAQLSGHTHLPAIGVCKQNLCIATSPSLHLEKNFSNEINPRRESFLKSKGIQCSSVGNGRCSAILSRRASRNCTKGLGETLYTELRTSQPPPPPALFARVAIQPEEKFLFRNYWAYAGKK